MDTQPMDNKPVDETKPVDNSMPPADTSKKDDAESVKKAIELLTQVSSILSGMGEDYSEDVAIIEDTIKSLTKEEDPSMDKDVEDMQKSKDNGNDFMDKLMG